MNKRKKPIIEIVKVFKILFGIVGAMIIFCGITHVMNYIYVSPNDSWMQRKMFHQFYEDKNNIDNIYIGSSHVYCDINAIQLNALNGQYNFDLATAGQPLNGTFYLLKEAVRNNNLSHVYVELYYLPSVELTETSTNRSMRNWQNIDYMKLSLNKLTYIFSIAGTDKYVDICIPFSRYRTKLNEWDYIKRVVEIKRQTEYKNYTYNAGSRKYLGSGYFYSEQIFRNKRYKQKYVLGENPMTEMSEKYLRKIIAYSQDINIPITLFISPIYELQLISTENYDNYINQVRSIAKEYNVPFYDFNLAKEECLPIQYEEYFADIQHLNNNGANMFTSFFYEVVTEDEYDNENYFYDSYTEKLLNTTPAVYGIYYKDSEDQENTYTVWVASNREKDLEYRIILTPNEGEQYMVQDFDENKEFEIPKNEKGICTIVARMKERPDEVQTMEIKY